MIRDLAPRGRVVIPSSVLLLLLLSGPVLATEPGGGQGRAPSSDRPETPFDGVLKGRTQKENRFDKTIEQASRLHRIPAALVKAVIRRESNFDAKARSKVGAMGLMQLMPATARRLGVKDPYDPIQNIDGGTRYLAELAELFKGDLISMLASYNAGEDQVFKRGFVPPFKETQNYVVRVLTAYVEYGGKLEVKPGELWRRTMKQMKKDGKEVVK